jgi:hypothetical protein
VPRFDGRGGGGQRADATASVPPHVGECLGEGEGAQEQDVLLEQSTPE